MRYQSMRGSANLWKKSEMSEAGTLKCITLLHSRVQGVSWEARVRLVFHEEHDRCLEVWDSVEMMG